MTVSGKKAEGDQGTSFIAGSPTGLHPGFSMADYVVVKDTKLSNGLLTVELQQQLPETMKPWRIAINGHMPPAEIKQAASPA